jgi:hypothetical protein
VVTASSTSETDSAALTAVAERCATDLASLEAKLQNLGISPAEKSSGRLWKRLKAAVAEKDLEQIRSAIHGHVLMMDVHLGLTQSATLNASASQLTQIMSLLQKIQSDVTGLQVKQPSAVPAATAESGDVPGTSPPLSTYADLATQTGSPDPQLGECVTRLMDLASKAECTVESDQAGQLIEDLELLLETAQERQGNALRRKSEAENVKQELKLMRSLLSSSPCLDLNKLGILLSTTAFLLAETD